MFLAPCPASQISVPSFPHLKSLYSLQFFCQVRTHSYFTAPTPVLTCPLSGYAALTCPNRTQDCCLRCKPGVKDDQQASSQMSAGESKARRSLRPNARLQKPRDRRREHPGSPCAGLSRSLPGCQRQQHLGHLKLPAVAAATAVSSLFSKRSFLPRKRPPLPALHCSATSSPTPHHGSKLGRVLLSPSPFAKSGVRSLHPPPRACPRTYTPPPTPLPQLLGFLPSVQVPHPHLQLYTVKPPTASAFHPSRIRFFLTPCLRGVLFMHKTASPIV